jgi:hypothetical protein
MQVAWTFQWPYLASLQQNVDRAKDGVGPILPDQHDLPRDHVFCNFVRVLLMDVP